MPEVSVIVVNFNSKKYIKGCFSSLYAQTFRDFEVILVDNASTDGSTEFVRLNYPAVKIIRNGSNLGYCKAVNIGIRVSHGKFIIPLNFDVLLEREFLDNLITTAKSDFKIGSVTGKFLKLKEEIKTKTIDTTGHIIKHDRSSKNRGEWQEDLNQYNKIEEVWGVCGVAPLYRREMLEDIRFENEYLDEDFVSGLDDSDIDWRARLLGWKAYYNPNAVAYHVRGGSITKFSRIWQFYNYRNRYLMLLKNETTTNYFSNFFSILIYELGMVFSMIIQFQFIPVVISYLILYPRFIRKRNVMQSRKKMSSKEIQKWFQ